MMEWSASSHGRDEVDACGYVSAKLKSSYPDPSLFHPTKDISYHSKILSSGYDSMQKSSLEPQEGIGYPASHVPSASQRHLCTRCKGVMKSPVQSIHCGHHYCSSCHAALLSKEDTPLCMACKEEDKVETLLDKKTAFPDRALSKEIDRLQTVCNCSWSGPVKEFGEHQLNCAKAYIICPDCFAPVKNIEFPQHKDSKNGACQPLVHCKYGCEGVYRQGPELEKHLTENQVLHLDTVQEKFNEVYNQVKQISEAETQLQERAVTQICQMNTSLTKQCEGIIARVNELESCLKELQSRRQDEESNDNHNISKKVSILSDVVAVLHKEMHNSTNRLHNQMLKDQEAITALQSKVAELESSTLRIDLTIRDLDSRMKTAEQGSMDGTMMWKITDVAEKRRQAKDGVITSMYSPTFMTNRYGYKMCVRLYFNGDGMGKGTHVSLFFVLLRGEYDALQQWPFRQKVTMTLIDQLHGQHHRDAFRPDLTSSSFARPVSSMNVASGCPLFLSQTELDKPGNAYIVNDTCFIQIQVETPPSPLGLS